MKETPVSRVKLLQARMLCNMGARAVTIRSATGIRLADARTLYKEMKGIASPSGQTPHSLEWYMERDARQLQASLLLNLYGLAIRQGYSAQQAFIAAYEVYFNVYGEPVGNGRSQSERLIDPERAHYLVKRSGDFGKLSAPGVGEAIAVQACRSCGLEILAPAHDRSYLCPHCAAGT
ncbi:MAG: FlhC family transcriptional regulator [Pseudomonadales bacterium]